MPTHRVPNPAPVTGHQIKALTKLRKARIANYSQITVPQIIRSEKRFLIFFVKMSEFIFIKVKLLIFYSAWRIFWSRLCVTGALT